MIRAGLLMGWFAVVQALTVLSALAGTNVTIGQNFPGSSFFTNSAALPPDANGAIGPQHFVEFNNGAFAAYDRNDPANVLRESDIDFWFNAGVNFANDQGITDP